MITLRATNTFGEMIDALKRIESRQWPFVLSTATNNSAFRMVDKLKRDIPRYIDRPVPFTINSFGVIQKATKTRLDATLGWRKWGGKKQVGAGRPLQIQTDGGSRPDKGFERQLKGIKAIPPGVYVVPSSSVERDAFGNIPQRYYKQVFVQVKNQMSQGKSLKKGKRSPLKFFAVYGGTVLGSKQSTRLADGIYERRQFGAGTGLRQIFFFTTNTNYASRFPAEKLGNEYLNTIITDEINKAIDQAIITTRVSP